MKLRRVFLIAAMVGSLAVLGCGDSGSGSSSGDGGSNGGGGIDGTGGMDGGGGDDPCADCAPGQQLEDCENDLLICDTFSDPGARESCIADAAC